MAEQVDTIRSSKGVPLSLHGLGVLRAGLLYAAAPQLAIRVGDANSLRAWQGQLHAGDLAATAEDSAGRQQSADGMRSHSRKRR